MWWFSNGGGAERIRDMSASREHGGPAPAGEEHKTMAAAQARQLASLRMSPRFVPGGVSLGARRHSSMSYVIILVGVRGQAAAYKSTEGLARLYAVRFCRTRTSSGAGSPETRGAESWIMMSMWTMGGVRTQRLAVQSREMRCDGKYEGPGSERGMHMRITCSLGVDLAVNRISATQKCTWPLYL